ncbi:Transposase DDE domain protein [uncultured archaeon]|nr:Transposase DDE domain protein [uncultured archaeon]
MQEDENKIAVYEFPMCPNCESRNTVHARSRKMQNILFWICKCRNCGNVFMTTEKGHPSNEQTKKTELDSFMALASDSKPSEKDGIYSPVWQAYNQAKTSEKEMFAKILVEMLAMLNVEYRKRKGHPNNELRDMIFSCAVKIYSSLSSRRAVSELELLKRNGFIEKVPHFNTLLNYFNDPQMTPILKKLIELSSLPLKQIEEDFAVDSSGFSTSIFSRWYDHKWGKETDTRQWVKCHLMSGVKTHIITSVEITDKNVADTKLFPTLVRKTGENFKIKEVSADKAYSSRDNLETVQGIGGIAYIPFRSNATGKRYSQIWRKMYEYFMLYREKFMEHYHKCSNVESVFHSLKIKFGNNLRCKNMTGMRNEILVKVLCYNIAVLIQEIHELGIQVDYCAENYSAQQIKI